MAGAHGGKFDGPSARIYGPGPVALWQLPRGLAIGICTAVMGDATALFCAQSTAGAIALQHFFVIDQVFIGVSSGLAWCRGGYDACDTVFS